MDENTTSTVETGVPVNEVVPAPVAPSEPTTPAPVATQPDFEAFPASMDLETKEDPTITYDEATGAAVGQVPVGTKFVAVGKYQTPHGVYFTDGRLSVKTIDLQHDEHPESADTQEPGDDEAQKIDVRVVPPAPNAWQRTFQRFMNPVSHHPTGTFMVHDLAAVEPDVTVTPETKIMVAGTFQKDSVKYYRAESSLDKNTWYGFPIQMLERTDAVDDLLPEDLFDPEEAKASEAAAGYGSTPKLAAAAGTSAGLLNRLRGKKA